MTDRRASLDDLPRYSPWPARLLGLAPWSPTTKTRSEIIREFEREKWRPLLERYRAERSAGRNVGLDDVDSWFIPSPTADLLVTIDDEWLFMSGVECRRRYVELIAKTLERIAPGRPVVELGAGYGGALFHVLRSSSSFDSGVGLEMCEGGIELMRELAVSERLVVETGYCDISSPEITKAELVPEGAVLLTSYATSYVPTLAAAFVERISSFRPTAVVQFEPFYETAAGDGLLSLLRRRYIEVNGYDRQYLTLLRSEAARGRIEIIHEAANAFGVNPLLPASIVAWRPAK